MKNNNECRKILEEVREGIWVLDQEAYSIYVNSFLTFMLRYDEKEMLGRRLFDFVAEDSIDIIRSRLSPSEEGCPDVSECRLFRKDGTAVNVSMVFSPRRNSSDGKLTGWIVTVRDNTYREKKRKSLLEKKAVAEESNRANLIFLASMSHEIRTPLNAIIGFIDIVLSDSHLKEENKEFLEYAMTSSKALLQIITDLLDFSKMQAGEFHIEETNFCLNDLLANVDSIAEMLIKKSGKEITLKKQVKYETQVELIGDQHRIMQIFLNLLTNAVKFTEEGFIEYGIVFQDDHRIEFFVRDTGEGIPEDKQQLIFEPFRQAERKYAKQSGGTGIGLAIVKRLVELMEGEIEVYSVYGEGSTFIFRLPIKKSQQGGTIVKESRSSKANQELPDGAGIHILVVDDNRINRKLAKKMLEKAGYQVLLAEDGEEAVSIYKKRSVIGMILLDIFMPKLDGIETVKLIREYEEKEGRIKTPVIALSADGTSGERRKMMAAGCDDFLTKPIDKRKLDAILRSKLLVS